MQQVGPNGEIGVSRQQFSSEYGPRAYNSCLKRKSFIVAEACGELSCEVINGRVVYWSMCLWRPYGWFGDKCSIVLGPRADGERFIAAKDRKRCFKRGQKCWIDDQGRQGSSGVG